MNLLEEVYLDYEKAINDWLSENLPNNSFITICSLQPVEYYLLTVNIFPHSDFKKNTKQFLTFLKKKINKPRKYKSLNKNSVIIRKEELSINDDYLMKLVLGFQIGQFISKFDFGYWNTLKYNV